nr:hypothetical protein Hi04_10k_c5016_00006 [uncultured bacterium]
MEMYQRLMAALPSDASVRLACIDIVLVVMVLTGQRKSAVTIQELNEQFPNRDCAKLVSTAINCGLLQPAVDSGVGVRLGKLALDIIRDDNGRKDQRVSGNH